MPTRHELRRTTWVLALWTALLLTGIRFFTSRRTPAPTGGGSSGWRQGQTISPEQLPSIERSQTSSPVSITLQANPDRPVAYTVEPWNGGGRLRRLTVVYEQSLDASESAILRSVDSGLPHQETPLQDVDDPRWLEKVRQHDQVQDHARCTGCGPVYRHGDTVSS